MQDRCSMATKNRINTLAGSQARRYTNTVAVSLRFDYIHYFCFSYAGVNQQGMRI